MQRRNKGQEWIQTYFLKSSLQKNLESLHNLLAALAFVQVDFALDPVEYFRRETRLAQIHIWKWMVDFFHHIRTTTSWPRPTIPTLIRSLLDRII